MAKIPGAKKISMKNFDKKFFEPYLEFDANEGVFYWKKTFANAKVGKKAGSISKKGYWVIGLKSQRYYLHHLVWLFERNEWPAKNLDHIDGDKLNNKFCNLRLADQKENNQNLRKPHRDSKTGFLGVSKKRNKFVAKICKLGKKQVLGIFNTAEEAHERYVEEKRKLHEFCTI